ncbi:MAG: FG-GAP repeat domain-containing protein [Vulcanimicrobiota bacterium]
MRIKVGLGLGLLLLLLLAGCTGGGSGASTSGGGSTSAGPPTALGSLNVVLALLNNRAVKSDVRRFVVNLRQNGQVVISREFTRSDLGSDQQLEIAEVPAGTYDLEILYLSDSSTVLGTYRQPAVSVAVGEITTISNPAFQNTLPDFDAPSFLPGGVFPSSFAIADFNEDAKPDLVFSDSLAASFGAPGRIYVGLGHGDGTYDRPFVLEVGTGPYWITTGDFNQDEHVDLATANRDDLSIVLGKGDGTFQPAQALSLSGATGALAIKVADLNGDTNLDLVTANFSSHNASVVLGLGNGSFLPAVNYSLGSGPVDILAIDTNGDQKLDLVSANSNDDNLSILLGVGDGTFVAGSGLAAGDSPWFLGSADFNHDQRADLVAVNGLDNTISVYLTLGSTGFAMPQTYPVGETPYSVSVNDLNGDGQPDLLVTNAVDSDFSILLGRSGGAFDPQYRVASAFLPNYAEFADVNGDSRLDIVSAQIEGSSVFVALGQGDGTFQMPGTPQMVGVQPRALRTADLDNDGNLDLMTANLTSGDVSIARGLADGTFLPAQSVDVPGSPFALAVEDLNEDRRPDLVVAGGGLAALLLGNGDGSFQPPQTIFSGPAGPVVVGDFNGDQHLDLALAAGNSFQLLPGMGDGTFGSPTPFDTGLPVSGLVATDLNRDRQLDVVTVSLQEKVTIHLGQGDGTFQPPQTIDVPDPAGGSISAFVAADDFTQDGHPDLVVTQFVSGTVTVLPGRGDGTFGTPAITPVGDGVLEVLTDDVNGDGLPDLTCTYTGITTNIPGVGVLVGKGDGTFDSPRFFYAGGATGSAVRGDFNHDGATDLAVMNILGNAITVLLAR